MKIFVIGARKFPDFPGGIEKHCEDLYIRLAKKKDIHITVIVIAKHADKKVEEWGNINIKYVKSINSKSFEKILYGLKACIYAIRKRPDIVHFQGLNCAIYIPLIKLFGVRVVYTQHSRDYLYPKWGRVAKLVWKISEKAALRADKIIAVSDSIHKHLKKYTDKSVVIYNGLNLRTSKIPMNVEKKFLSKYNLEKNNYIFFAGRFTEEKSIEDLINAFNQIDTKKIKLVIAGDADYDRPYSKMIKDLAVKSNNIILTGFISGDDLKSLFSNAKLFVLPSKYEGLPVALLEALSYGIEVLASDIEANLQLDLNKDSFFKQGDIKDLKKKIIYHLNHEIDEIEKLKRVSFLKDKYDWDMIAEKTLRIYEEIL